MAALDDWFRRDAAVPESTANESSLDDFFPVSLGIGEDGGHRVALLPKKKADADLAAKSELEDLYVLYGRNAFNFLTDRINTSAQIHRLNLGRPKESRIAFANYPVFASAEAVEECRVMLLIAVDAAKRPLVEGAKDAQEKLQKFATGVALERLKAAKTQIDTEFHKYFTAGLTQAQVQNAKNLPAAAILRGASIARLVGSQRKLQTLRAALRRAGQEVEQRPGDAEARERMSTLAEDYTDLLTSLGADDPVLFRLADVDVPDSVRLNEQPPITLVASTAEGARSIGELTTQVWAALRSAADNNRMAQEAIDGSPERVWHYATLIEWALDDQDLPADSVEGRAAQERIMESQTRVTERVTQALGSVDLFFMVNAMSPPVMAVSAAANVVAGGIDLVNDVLDRKVGNAVAGAFLDPAQSFAQPQGYWGAVANAAFMLLQLKGMRDSVRAWQSAGAAEADMDAVAAVVSEVAR